MNVSGTLLNRITVDTVSQKNDNLLEYPSITPYIPHHRPFNLNELLVVFRENIIHTLPLLFNAACALSALAHK